MLSFRSLRSSVLLLVISGLGLGACNEITGVDGLDITDPEGEGPWALVDAGGVTVTQVSLYQRVKDVLMDQGQPVASNVPIVAGRDALMRVAALDASGSHS